jgi:DNA-binding LacI/PurR family transcriptional regulator
MIKEFPTGKAVTLRDIAIRAGVNRSTVSRVLNNSVHFPVSEASRNKIMAIAKELQYQPKLSAKSLASGKSYSVNILFGSIYKDFTSPVIAELVDAISWELRKNNYNLILTPVTTSDSDTMTREIQKILSSCTVDGSIISDGLLDKKLRNQFNTNRIPAVLLNMHSKEEDFGCFPFIHHLVHDENQGQEELLKHLMELGHKKIAYINNGACTDIMLAFRKAVAKYNFDFTDEDVFSFYDWRNEYVNHAKKQMYYYRKIAEKWKLLKKYSAIICSESIGALGIIEFFRDKGMVAGKDISIAGNNKYKELDTCLTAVDNCPEETAKKAVKMLLHAIEHPDSPMEHVKIQTKLFIGKTTGKALGTNDFINSFTSEEY